MIKVNNLSFDYGGEKILDNLTFKLEDKKIYGLVGRNGAGKTTLFNCLIGKYKIKEGKILIDGKNTTDMKYLDNPLVLIDNSKIFFKDLTVKEHFNLLNNSMKKEEVAELMKAYNLLEYEGMYPGELSLGTAQRFNIALRMQHMKSNNVLADEPFNGLDPVETEELKKKFSHLKKEKMVIISSHDILSLTSLCDEIIFLKDSKITKVKIGDNQEIGKIYELLQ